MTLNRLLPSAALVAFLFFAPATARAAALGSGDLIALFAADTVRCGSLDDTVEVGQDAVERVDPATGERTVLSAFDVGEGPPFSSPAGLALDHNGDILVADVVADALFRVRPRTGEREIVTSNEVGAGTPLRWLNDVAVTPDGEILVISFLEGAVARVDRDTGDRETIFTAPFPGGMALGPDGALWVTATQSLYRIDVATGDAVLVSASTIPPVGSGPSLSRPGPLVVLETGEVIVGDDERLLRVDPLSGDRTLLNALCCGDEWVSLSVEDENTILSTRGFDLLGRIANDGTFLDQLFFLPGSDHPLLRDAIVVPAGLPDGDGDGVLDPYDVCPDDADADQPDADRDGVGDLCNDAIDRDGDDYADELDSCPFDFDPLQEDRDGDTIGDLCDEFPDSPENELLRCSGDLASCQLDTIALEAELDACLSRPPDLPDADGDGEADPTDSCVETPIGEAVDSAGCSQEQFCAGVEMHGFFGRFRCLFADWRNDDLRPLPGDCRPRWGRAGHGCVAQ